MAGDSNVFVPIVLPPEIMAQMPPGLTMTEKLDWRDKRIAEFRAKQEQEAAAAAQVSDESTQQAESDEKADISADDVSANTVSKRNNSQKTKTSKKRGAIKSPSDDKDTTSVRGIPKDIFVALKRIFPQSERNSDLLAAAYIITNGDCDIPTSAMELVKSYNANDAMRSVAEELAGLRRAVRSLDERTSAIELCACYDLYDRRYGAKERRRSPKENEFREQGNLDMLNRLRVQAKDQRKLDDIERGRSIYEHTKDKDDKKKKKKN